LTDFCDNCNTDELFKSDYFDHSEDKTKSKYKNLFIKINLFLYIDKDSGIIYDSNGCEYYNLEEQTIEYPDKGNFNFILNNIKEDEAASGGPVEVSDEAVAVTEKAVEVNAGTSDNINIQAIKAIEDFKNLKKEDINRFISKYSDLKIVKDLYNLVNSYGDINIDNITKATVDLIAYNHINKFKIPLELEALSKSMNSGRQINYEYTELRNLYKKTNFSKTRFVIIQFKSQELATGADASQSTAFEDLGPQIDLNIESTPRHLTAILNYIKSGDQYKQGILSNCSKDKNIYNLICFYTYKFFIFINDKTKGEITDTIEDTMNKMKIDGEKTINIMARGEISNNQAKAATVIQSKARRHRLKSREDLALAEQSDKSEPVATTLKPTLLRLMEMNDDERAKIIPSDKIKLWNKNYPHTTDKGKRLLTLVVNNLVNRKEIKSLQEITNQMIIRLQKSVGLLEKAAPDDASEIKKIERDITSAKSIIIINMSKLDDIVKKANKTNEDISDQQEQLYLLKLNSQIQHISSLIKVKTDQLNKMVNEAKKVGKESEVISANKSLAANNKEFTEAITAAVKTAELLFKAMKKTNLIKRIIMEKDDDDEKLKEAEAEAVAAEEVANQEATKADQAADRAKEVAELAITNAENLIQAVNQATVRGRAAAAASPTAAAAKATAKK
jgi:hypothetical protein